jgi:signal transduction histidine kinase/ActR/RegA family two-component response regulator
VQSKGATLAHLDVTSARRLTSGDREFLEAVADLIAAGIHRAHADAEAARMRTRGFLMAEIGAIASAPLDLATRVSELARIVVPRMADWCAIDLVDEAGELHRMAIEPAGGRPGLRDDPSAAPPAFAVGPEDPAAVAARDGITQLVPRVEDEDVRNMAADEPHAEHLRRVGLRSLLSVPLSARDRTLGVITLATVSRPSYDVTDLAMAEELAARAALALDNARLHEQLVAEDRAKSELLSQLGHEIRNPLAPIVHSLEVLRVTTHDSEAHERARRVLGRQVDQLRHLVRDLLDAARVTRGTIELHPEPVELGAAVADALESCQNVLEAHRHEVVHPAPASPVWIEADSVRLEQILVNLVQTAAENSPPGARTELSIERETEAALVRVRGEGAAVSWSRVLAPPADAGDVGSAGIGLHLSKRLVDLHGGAIEVRHAEAGAGEMVMRLPLAASAPSRRSAETARAERVASRLRILVVDDHLDSAAALAELMALWGHDVRSTIDGREALRIADSFHPELVLLDLAMPDMNGYELAAELRRHPDSAGATMVAITGQPRERGREEAAGVEFDYHWIKPLDVPAFRAFIEERARQRPEASLSPWPECEPPPGVAERRS